MKKLFAFAMLTLPFTGFSQQGYLDKLKDKAKARTEQRVDEGMDKAIDKAEEELTRKPEAKKGSDTPKKTEEQPGTNATAPSSAKSETKATSFKVYSKFDFIPGERIVYAEDFSQDEIGELPLNWSTNKRGETVTLESHRGKWMQLFSGSRYASPALQKLPDNFTVEMDVMLQYTGEEGYTYPDLEFKMLELQPGDTKARSFLVDEAAANEVSFVLVPHKTEPATYLKSFAKGTDYFSNEPKELKSGSLAGKPFHLSVWVQKERIRIWMDAEKVCDIPQGIPEGAVFNRIGFGLTASAYTPDQFGVFLSNIKVAEGTPDLRNKLLTEGKLVTTGILFDVASAKIKPESAGVLKGIAAVLKENTSLKVKIIGHTDSDGDDAKNIDLSKQRAEAVKNALSTEFDIEASRVLFDGLGESKPVAENTSKEGKAKNRRVEFIKL
ncbi:OmpA family protein [Flavitalea antarctica]